MKNWFLISFLLFTISAKSQPNKSISWATDIEFLKTELPAKHKNVYAEKSEAYFFEGIKRVALQTDSLSDFEIAIKLQQLISSFGDSHTGANWGQFVDKNKILPLHLFWFSDGIFILHTTAENKEVLGCKIVKINGNPIQVVIDSLSTMLTVDNNAVIKSNIPKLIPLVQLLQFFGLAKAESIELQLENQEGELFTYSIKPAYMDRENRVMFKPDSLALCNRNERAYFVDYEVAADNVYYIQYNKCISRENPPYGFKGNLKKLPSFQEFQKKILKTVTKKSFDKIIVDLRFNSGGNSTQGTELIEKMAAIKKINERGKLYVILGRFTFSAAIINAMDFSNKTQAIFVGEETSGKPNHYGEVRSFTLPNSGLNINYSTKYFKRSEKNLKTITPDYIIESSFRDFKEGKDPIYDWIVKQ